MVEAEHEDTKRVYQGQVTVLLLKSVSRPYSLGVCSYTQTLCTIITEVSFEILSRFRSIR